MADIYVCRQHGLSEPCDLCRATQQGKTLGPPERIRVVIRAATSDDWIGVAYCKDYTGDPSTIHEYTRPAAVAGPLRIGSEVLKIIRFALTDDRKALIQYSLFLAEKVEQDDPRLAAAIRSYVEGQFGKTITTAATSSPALAESDKSEWPERLTVIRYDDGGFSATIATPPVGAKFTHVYHRDTVAVEQVDCVLCHHGMNVDKNGHCKAVVAFTSEHDPNDEVRCGCYCAPSDKYAPAERTRVEGEQETK